MEDNKSNEKDDEVYLNKITEEGESQHKLSNEDLKKEDLKKDRKEPTDKNDKHRKKDKHKDKQKDRDRDRHKDKKHRSRSRSRKHRKDKKKKKHRYRSSSRSSSNKYTRRKTQRKVYQSPSNSSSNSPLRNYTWRQQIQDPALQNADDNAARKYWDGFHWVVKTNHNACSKDPSIMQQTQRMRKVQISNLPLYLGLSEQDVFQLVQKYLIENYLNEKNNQKPVINVDLDTNKSIAVVELSSLDEATRMVKLGCLGIFNHNCKITRYGEMQTQQNHSLSSLVQTAQTTAQAQAAAHIAMQQFQNNFNHNQTITSNIAHFSLGQGMNSKECSSSRVIKVYDIINPYKLYSNSQKDWDEVEGDIVTEFTEFGAILSCFIVRSNQQMIGAQAGTVFIEFNDSQEAMNAVNGVLGRKYDGNDIKVVFIPEEVYFKNFYPIFIQQQQQQQQQQEEE